MKTGLIIALALLMGASACQKGVAKDKTTSVTVTELSGYWYGNFSGGSEGEVFNPNGSTIQYDFYGTNLTDTASAPYKGNGSFSLKNDSLFFTVVYPTVGNETFTERAYVNTSVTPYTITGVYTGSQSGSFTLTKQ